jgi:hypothetical protein
MTFAEEGGRIVVRHRTRMGLVKWMAYLSAFCILPLSVLLFFTRLYARMPGQHGDRRRLRRRGPAAPSQLVAIVEGWLATGP